MILKIQESNNLRNSLSFEYKDLATSLKTHIDPDRLEITNLIFGHTHNAETASAQNVSFANTGSWHHTKNPAFIEIHDDGKIVINKFSPPKEEIIVEEEIPAP